MFQRVSAVMAAMSLALVSAWAVATPASAAPPTDPWAGAAGGSTSRFDLTAGTVDLTNVELTTSTSTVDSQATPRSVSRSENLAAAVVGLPVGPDANQQVAPPDQGGAETGTLATVNAVGINGGVVTTRNEAHWPGDGVCLAAGEPLADTTTSTDGTSVSPLGADLLTSGASSTRGVVSLESTGGDGLNRAVQSEATGTIGNTDVLGGLVTIGITGDAVLTATADGTAGGATVDYQAPVITVTTAGGDTQTVQPGDTVTIDLGVAGSVSVTANEPVSTIDPNGLSAQSTVDVATIDVQTGVGAASVNASFDLLPLNAGATVPAGGIDCPAPLDITAPADGSTVTDPTPVISGTGQPGANVTITIDGTDYGPVEVDDDGTFSVPVTDPLDPGTYTATGVQTDDDGNPIGTDDVTFTVAAPAPPVITDPEDGDTTGPTPTITGTGEPGATITVTIGGVEIGTAVVDDDGNFAVDVTDPLDEGPQTAVATETIDGVEIGTDSVDFTVDAAEPIVIQAPADGSSTNDSTPVITGTGDPGATVTISIDGDEVGTTTVGDDGTFSFTPTDPLDDGEHTVIADQTAPDGTDLGSDEVTFTVDTATPAAPVVTSPDDGGVTSDPTPVITGTAEPGSTVTIFIDGDEVGVTTADDNGNFTLELDDPLEPGEHTVTATATDDAGNTSPESELVTFTVTGPTGNGPGSGPGSGPGNGPGSGGPTDSLGSLAQTGGPTLWVGIIGALLLVAGAGTVIHRRRLRV